jgi:hypothetical protein
LEELVTIILGFPFVVAIVFAVCWFVLIPKDER